IRPAKCRRAVLPAKLNGVRSTADHYLGSVRSPSTPVGVAHLAVADEFGTDELTLRLTAARRKSGGESEGKKKSRGPRDRHISFYRSLLAVRPAKLSDRELVTPANNADALTREPGRVRFDFELRLRGDRLCSDFLGPA